MIQLKRILNLIIQTVLKHFKLVMVIIFLITVLFIVSYKQQKINNIETISNKDIQKAIIISQKLQKKVEEEEREKFLENPHPLLKTLLIYKAQNNWEKLILEAKPFLETNNLEVKDLYEIALLKMKEENAERIEKIHEQEQITNNQKYIALINRMIEEMKVYDVSKHLANKESIIIASAVYSAMALHIDDAKNYNLNEQQRKRIDAFKKVLTTRQKNDYPKLRNAYGPAARKVLWEEDITVSTFGEKYKIIEFTGGLFIKNKNIASFQTGLLDTLLALRFDQVRYKWSKRADEYTNYNLDSMPSDTDIRLY